MLFDTLVGRFLKRGRLTVTFADGRTRTFGAPDPELAHVHVAFKDAATERAVALKPQLALGEAYMDGRLLFREGDIVEFLRIVAANLGTGFGHPIFEAIAKARCAFRSLAQYNPIPRAQANVAHHYDLSGALYDTFLDEDRQYSCAYFERPDDTLETAQAKKKRHIAAKLAIEPGMRVLDIGSGWGGLGLYLARECGARVVGVTLSEEQLALSRRRAHEAGLEDRVEFRLQDYRTLDERFDRIVSVGMFEHVGVAHYREFFDQVERLLDPKGVGLVHAIGRSDGPGHTNLWIAKYIFPGGYTPALSEVVPKIERSGLMISDIEILRLHYAETLKEWRRRFRAHWAEVARLYDERFCRMWEFYLAGAEMGFRYQGLMVFQIQIVKHVEALPITRDYMLQWEATHQAPKAVAPARAA
ncbi:MAG: class I SAM-dependent methyltransferase [Alphaproteobacteria bacterium]|nr:class I SAM-dependent methyltransferase [Alphaproteobacteria bacterium]